MTEVKLDVILTLRDALSKILNRLVPFAQESTDTTHFPAAVTDAGLCGQTGQEDPEDNRGVTGIQVPRGFYNSFFKAMTAVTSGLDKLNSLVLAVYDVFIRDYAHNDRRYDARLNYIPDDVAYQEYQGLVAHGIYNGTAWDSVTLLHERGKTVLYEPSIVLGPVPDWAIDIGSGATYSFSAYPGLDNDLFKGVMRSMSDFGASVSAGTFTAPDLRGISPGVFTDVAGKYLVHSCGQHKHASDSVALTFTAADSAHSHGGAEAAHSAHTHSLTFRLGHSREYWTEGEPYYMLCNNGNDKKTWTVYTTGVNSHTHTISVSNATESHYHKVKGSMTSGGANTGHRGNVNRVSTYPVHFIVRVV